MKVLHILAGGALVVAAAGFTPAPADAMSGAVIGNGTGEATVIPAYVKNGKRYFNGRPLADYYRSPDDYRSPYRASPYGPKPYGYNPRYPYPYAYPYAGYFSGPGVTLQFGY